MSVTFESGEHVDATLNYLASSEERPIFYAYPAPSGVPQYGGEVAAKTLPIFNARVRSEPPSLDSNGFQLVAHHSRVSDFSDEKTIRDVYYPETEDLIRKVTEKKRPRARAAGTQRPDVRIGPPTRARPPPSRGGR